MHYLSVKEENGNTTLSSHFWSEKEAGRRPVVTWSILDSGLDTYNPTTKKCNLCIREKFFILFEPEKATLNARQELFGSCRHKAQKLLLKKPPKRK